MYPLDAAQDDCVFPFCPAPPNWSLDWPMIVEHFACLRPLADVRQDPVHHPEGDVLTHTRLAVEALVEHDGWRELPAGERTALFAAALLHDLGKATHTQVGPDGRITAIGHACASVRLARPLLWKGDGLRASLPFSCRSMIEWLVLLHGLPLWSWNDPELQRRVIRASYSVRLDRLALLAEADVRGRTSSDRAALLERIELFRLYCLEQGCYDRPRPFASDHARFIYFQRGGADPDYVPYERDPFEVVLMVGLPAAGKDTWIQQHIPDRPVISLDHLRTELGIAPADAQGSVIREAKERAKMLLRRRQPFVWNATNVTRRMRQPLIDLFVDYGAHVHLVYVDAAYNLIQERNRRRKEPVPERMLATLLDKLELPDASEAHRVTLVH